MDKKLSKKNLIYNIIFILLLTIVMFSFIFRGENKEDIISVLGSVKSLYLFIGIILSLGFVFGEAINIKVLLRLFGYEGNIMRTLKYAFTGFFFSSITPSSTGGQPMQVYEMKTDGIEIYHSSIILLLELMAYQASTVLYGLTGFIWASRTNFIDSKLVKYMIVSGLILNIIGIIFISFCIFNPKMSFKICGLVEKIIKKLPMKEEKKSKIIYSLREQIEEYNNCAKYVRGNYKVLLKVFLVTVLQMGSLFSVSYIIYLALGQTGKSLLEVVLIQSLIYVGSSFIPLPGAVGVSETNFLSMFRKIYTENLLSGALLLSRGISFYLLLIISVVALVIYKLVDLNRKKHENIEEPLKDII